MNETESIERTKDVWTYYLIKILIIVFTLALAFTTVYATIHAVWGFTFICPIVWLLAAIVFFRSDGGDWYLTEKLKHKRVNNEPET